MIGESYHYPQSKKVFKLKSIEGYIYIFECGHRCTDKVFPDLINVRTKIQNYKNIQLELF